jgi:hypothetical protein
MLFIVVFKIQVLDSCWLDISGGGGGGGVFATWLNHGGTGKVVFIQFITCGKVSFLCMHK